ncbi:LytR C-terminal domain-containing protein [Smaragdicoccus niigatensis]|uniref:LytR C-terminal domain-containing protein n=1 Tax=Smaragdicoccus niigatensis TaxID=359359 RepID=UPI00036F8D43|nr:LytR C-terminal domain-containing protein [Smaragdicoccus niigatensis]
MTIDELAPPHSEAEPTPAVERAPQPQQPPAVKLESPGPPLRALAMVLIALGIVFAGLGLKDFSVKPSGDGSALQTTSVAPAGDQPKKAEAPATAAQVKAVGIRVFNNSEVVGVASKTAKKLTDEGWKVVETGNSTLSLKRTTVYYGTSAAEKQAALEIADQLGIAAEKKTSEVSGLGNGVLVVLVN